MTPREMSDPAFGGAFHCPPPRWNLWRWLGFGTPGWVRPDEAPGFAPGWLVTETTIRFDWRDRLRLLVSGKAMVRVSTQTDLAVCRSRSVGAVGVLPPTFRVRRP